MGESHVNSGVLVRSTAKNMVIYSVFLKNVEDAVFLQQWGDAFDDAYLGVVEERGPEISLGFKRNGHSSAGSLDVGFCRLGLASA